MQSWERCDWRLSRSPWATMGAEAEGAPWAWAHESPSFPPSIEARSAWCQCPQVFPLSPTDPVYQEPVGRRSWTARLFSLPGLQLPQAHPQGGQGQGRSRESGSMPGTRLPP